MYLRGLADEAVEEDYVGCVTIVTTRDGVMHVTSDRERDFRTVAGELISALFDAAHQAQVDEDE